MSEARAVTGSKKIETHVITWRCMRCRVSGNLPPLHCLTIGDVRDAIARGHDRRSGDCHAAHGIRHVRAVQDGIAYRFAAPAPSTASRAAIEHR